MTEKQRWLLRDLEAWREQQMQKIGRYGPHRAPSTPPTVRAAIRTIAIANRVIRQWEKSRTAPWERQRDAIQARAQEVKRVILFEKTETALRVIRGLK